MGSPGAGTSRPSVWRALGRLNSPLVYLATLGGLQIALLWVFRFRLGIWIPAAATAGWLGLLALLLIDRDRWVLKQAFLYALVGISGLGPPLLGIVQRPRLGLTIEHDGLVQTEAAVDRLIQGQPIYGVDWSNTALAQIPWGFDVPNPALHHLVYFPLTMLAAVPVRLLTGWLALPFDGRIVLLLMSLLALVVIATLPIAPPARFMVTTAVFMSPLITLYMWSGRNDIEFLAFVLLSLALLARGQLIPASAALGTAIAFKPFAIFAAPFLLLVLYDRWRQGRFSRRQLLANLIALAVVPVLSIGPFLLTNPRAFWTDTVAYTSGAIPDAYPIGGFGFGGLVLALHLVNNRTDAYPFALFQLPAMALAFWVLARRFLNRPTLGRWIAGYAGLFAAFAFFARYFNDSYLGVVLTIALCIAPFGSTTIGALGRRRPDALAA